MVPNERGWKEDILIRRIKGDEFEQLFKLVYEGFKKEIDVVGFDIQRLQRMARFYRQVSNFLFILNFLRIDFEIILVAVLGDKVVGEIHLVPHGKNIWSLDSAAVDKAFRRRGIYRKLMNAALKYISERRGKRILRSVLAGNVAPMKMTSELQCESLGKERLLLLESSETIAESVSGDFVVREMKPEDSEQIYQICKTLYSRKLQAYEMSSKDFVDSIWKRLRNRISHVNSVKWIAEIAGKIVGYAEVTYTSPQEAANIEFFCASSEVDLSAFTRAILGKTQSLLSAKNIRKIKISLDEEWKEALEAFQHLGFEPIASFYKSVKELS